MIRHTDLTLQLDESIKTHDKELYDQCFDLARNYGFRVFHHVQSRTKIPIIIIGSKNFFNELKRDESYDLRILINIDTLSLFSSDKNELPLFEFDNFDEIFEAWPFLVKLLVSKLRNLESSLLISQKKEIVNLFKIPLNLNNSYLYLPFERELLSYKIRDFNIQQINELIQEKLAGDYFLVSLDTLLAKELDFFLPIPYMQQQTVFLASTKKFTDNYLYKLIYDYFLRELSLLEYERKLDEIAEIKNLIPEPILILNSEGDAIIYNNAFTKLSYSLRLCAELQDGEQLEIQDASYKVVIQEKENGDRAYFFFPIDAYISLGAEPTTQELGIISSSLAHELNNPLGGILAAINVLELDVTDLEVANQLSEMKQGVLRCKNLVEMFLGFSRLDSQIHLTHSLEIKQIIQQSFDLIRFRMVEMNMNFNFNYKYKNKFELSGNPYVLSMVFYLLWSGLVTAYSRHKLVALEVGEYLNISIEENTKYISIRFLERVHLEDLFLKSKLFIHLCDLGQIKIESHTGLIELTSEIK